MQVNRRRPRSKFERWVLEFGGTRKLSIELNVSQTTVQNWCAKRATPTLEIADQILSLAKTKLTISDIVNGTK